MKRATIADIAKAAGVSTASVSYALNQKKGLADATRQRILEVAMDFGWEPDFHASKLAGAPTGAYGWVMRRSIDVLQEETFSMQFLTGLETELHKSGCSVLLHLEWDAERENAVYRSWSARRQVDGVILLDIEPDDARITLLQDLGMPVVLAGRPADPTGHRYTYADDVADMYLVVDDLVAQGFRRFGRVLGDEDLLFTAWRQQAFVDRLAHHGITDFLVTRTGFTDRESVRVSTLELMAHKQRPQVIIYDSDLLAIWGQHVLQGAGYTVPDDIGVVAFDNSSVCTFVTPEITALERRPVELGRRTAELLLGPPEPRGICLPRGEFLHRGSTAAVPD